MAVLRPLEAPWTFRTEWGAELNFYLRVQHGAARLSVACTQCGSPILNERPCFTCGLVHLGPDNGPELALDIAYHADASEGELVRPILFGKPVAVWTERLLELKENPLAAVLYASRLEEAVAYAMRGSHEALARRGELAAAIRAGDTWRIVPAWIRRAQDRKVEQVEAALWQAYREAHSA